MYFALVKKKKVHDSEQLLLKLSQNKKKKSYLVHFFPDSQGLLFACSKDNYLYLDDVMNSRLRKKIKLAAESFYAQDLY